MSLSTSGRPVFIKMLRDAGLSPRGNEVAPMTRTCGVCKDRKEVLGSRRIGAKWLCRSCSSAYFNARKERQQRLLAEASGK
jgi:hypothetical protein